MKRHIVFLVVSGIVFSAIAVVFLVLPRSEFSELEKRRLAKFPDYSHEALLSGKYTGDISSWFSDSEPFRDELMTLSMAIKNSLALKVGGGDAVTFHAEPGAGAEEPPQPTEEEIEAGNRDIAEISAVGVDGPAKVASAGIIVAGEEPEVRALMVYYGEATGGAEWAQAANFYKETLPDVDIYCMVVPTAIEFYCPEKVKSRTRSQLSTIRNIYSLLRPDVHAVDAYTPLGTHASEPIYFRTDHHWTTLGAYYAWTQFAEVADLPVRGLEHYQRETIFTGFYGTTYNKAHIKVKPDSVELFHNPGEKGINVDMDDGKLVAGSVYFPEEAAKGFNKYNVFFSKNTFKIVVTTEAGTGKSLLLVKDSFANCFVPFLAEDYDQIIMVDYRYGKVPVKDIIEQYKNITDVLVMFNTEKFMQNTKLSRLAETEKDGTGMKKFNLEDFLE